MSGGTKKVHHYKDLGKLSTRLRSDVKDLDCVLLYAYRRVGRGRSALNFSVAI